ncbi:MAG: amidohydrolase family protein, partial [Roseobacter sp.]
MDTPTATWRKAAAVYVRGSKIERISEDQTLCGSEFELNLEGLFLIPGLIDPHVHISENPSRKAVMFSERSIDASVQLVVENGTTALDFGITTVRDMGSHLGNLSNILNDERLISYDLPEIIHCGQILTYDEGHMSSCGAAIEGIYDGRRVIADNRRSGASFTKVTSDPEDTEAQGREPNPAFSKETLSGIADVSESVGLPVACHTFPSVDGVSRALEAGVFTIEHAVPLNDPQMTRAKANGSIFVPTLVAAFDDFPPNFLETRYGIARDTLEFWDRAAGDQTRQELDCDPPESIVTWVDRVLPRLGK